MNVAKFTSGTYTTVMFPNNSDSRSRDTQIIIPTEALLEYQANGNEEKKNNRNVC